VSPLLGLRLYFAGLGVVAFIWWPVSHWLFPDWYHRVLGFRQYDRSSARIIGTTGLPFVGSLFLVAMDPLASRSLVMLTIGFLVALAATYVDLIRRGEFPRGELFNVVLCFANAVIMGVAYPW
jgi:hypothetical protein